MRRSTLLWTSRANSKPSPNGCYSGSVRTPSSRESGRIRTVTTACRRVRGLDVCLQEAKRNVATVLLVEVDPEPGEMFEMTRRRVATGDDWFESELLCRCRGRIDRVSVVAREGTSSRTPRR